MSSLKAMFDKFLDRLMAPSPTQELYHSEILPLIPGFDTPTIIPPTPVTAPVTVAPTALSVSSLPIKTHVTGATVAFVNHSSVVTDAQIVALVKALQIQVDRDFTPIWKISAQLVAVPTNATPAADAWVIAIMDTSDQAGALGYHDITSTGTPLGRVFAKDDIHYGLSWTVTVSHELCLTGDTKIALLDGSSPPIKDLVGRDNFAVYSCDESGNIKAGRAHSARLTQSNAPIFKITLDNGEIVRCTGNHPFLLRDGSYQEAHLLEAGTSLMPLYRRREKIDADKKTSSKSDYEQVYNPATDDWKFTHRVVQPYCPSGFVRHHKDFDRFNNSPANIEVMEWLAHQQLHAKHIRFYADQFNASGKKRNISPKVRKALKERGRAQFLIYNGSEKHLADLGKYWTDETRAARGKQLLPHVTSAENISRLIKMNQSAEARERAATNLTTYNKSPKHRAIAAELGRNMLKALWADDDYRKRKCESQSIASKMRWANPEYRLSMKESLHNKRHLNKPNQNCDFCLADTQGQNHKVVSVEACGFENVYDLTVDKFHNFALNSGIFVHNCEMLVDPWIANTVFFQNSNTTGMLYALEVCDPPENDSFGYEINGILVSDFVYPAWFEGFRTANSTQFDHCNLIHKPFELLSGGYIGVFPVNPQTKGWNQLLASGKPGARALRKSSFSRTRRRGVVPVHQDE